MKFKYVFSAMLIALLGCSGLVAAEEYQPMHDSAIIPCADGSPMTLINNEGNTPASYNEVYTWLQEDKTNEIEYDLDTFKCVDFAENLHNNAESAGFKCGIVLLTYETIMHLDGSRSYTGHSINVFQLDNGDLLYVDPLTDLIAIVETGSNYAVWDLNGNTIFYKDKVIKDVWIAW